MESGKQPQHQSSRATTPVRVGENPRCSPGEEVATVIRSGQEIPRAKFEGFRDE